jgi:hypothetical protein
MGPFPPVYNQWKSKKKPISFPPPSAPPFVSEKGNNVVVARFAFSIGVLLKPSGGKESLRVLQPGH